MRFAVTVERVSRDTYGAPAGAPAVHNVAGCVDWPESSAEVSTSFTQVEGRRTLSAPAGADVLANDTIVYPNGDRWHVVGDPYAWQSPFTGRRPGVTVTLERVR